MTRYTKLFSSPTVSVDRSDHPKDQVHIDGSVARITHYDVTFVVSGEFRVERSHGTWAFSPGDVLLCYPGVSQAVFHPASGARDVCLCMRFASTGLEDILGSLPSVKAVPRRPASASNAFNLWRLQEALKNDDRLTVESVALSSAQSFLGDEKTAFQWRAVDRNFSWYRLRVKRVCDYIAENCSCDCSLIGLARLAGISPFHFTRVFHYFMGLPVHQYVANCRMTEAAKAIRQGEPVSDAAYGLGFSSLSYFSRAFRRHFGQSPSDFRKAARGQAAKAEQIG